MINLFFDRKNGKISLTRILSFIIVVTILSVYIMWNIYALIKNGIPISIGANEVYLIGVSFGAKVAQNVLGEKNKEPSTKETV